MNFGTALELLKVGQAVTRAGWNGKGMWLKLQKPDAGSKMTLPYIYMSTADGNLVPWLASQTDMLAEDWDLSVAGNAVAGIDPSKIDWSKVKPVPLPTTGNQWQKTLHLPGCQMLANPWMSINPPVCTCGANLTPYTTVTSASGTPGYVTSGYLHVDENGTRK